MKKVARQCVIPPTVKITTHSPFELLAVDLVTFPKSKDGYVGCCVAIDHNSKWLSAVPIRNKTTTTVCDALEHHIFPCLPRLPERLLSDNGKEFTSREFQEMLQRYSIKHVLTTPYKPSSNGCVERVNRTLGELLRSAESLDGTWRGNLTRAILTYNNTRHRELNLSPSEYLINKKHATRDAVLISETDAEFWRRGHPKFIAFAEGQHVLRKVPRQGHSANAKFMPKYEGPFEVTRINKNGVTYELERVDTRECIKAHHTQLIPWTAPPDYLKDRLRQFECRDQVEGVASELSDYQEEFDFEGFPALSTTSSSAEESSDTTDSESSVAFCHQGRTSNVAHKKLQIEVRDGDQGTDESMCFVEAVRSQDTSLVFGKPKNYCTVAPVDCYKLCCVDKDNQCEEVAFDNNDPQGRCSSPSEPSGIVLTPAEDLWELSSISASDEEVDLQVDSTHNEPDKWLGRLERYVGALDSVLEGASAAIGQMVSYISSPSTEFDGFVSTDLQEVDAQRKGVLSYMLADETHDERQSSQKSSSVEAFSRVSDQSLSEEL